MARWSARAATAIMGMVIAAGPPSMPTGFAVAPAAAQGSDEATRLHELAERLLPQATGASGTLETVALLPGQLPAGLPFDMPLPAEARLLGSLVRVSELSGTSLDVVLDAPAPASDLQAFFDRAMEQRGWSPPTFGPSRPGGPGGFPPGFPGGFRPEGYQPELLPLSSTFCVEENGPVLTITVTPRPSANEVRARVQMPLALGRSGFGSCSRWDPPRPPPYGPMAPGPELVPVLSPPAAVQLQPSGMANLGLNAYGSQATAITDMGVAEIEAHFARQLGARGWTRRAGNADATVAWSMYRVPNEDEWQGLLMVMRGRREGERSLLIRVDSAPREDPVESIAEPIVPPPVGPAGRVRASEPALVRDLAERLLAEPYGGQARTGQTAEVLLDALPPDLPFAVPVPPGGRLLGSMVKSLQGQGRSVEIVLDAPGPPDDAQAFFLARFASAGLGLGPFGSPGAAATFQEASANRTSSLCEEETGLRLTLGIRPRPSGVNDVRISTYGGTPASGPCWPDDASDSGYRGGRFQAPRVAIPPLLGPPGARIQPGMNSMGGAHYATSATAVIDWSASQLAAFFRGQLEAAGWAQVAGAASGPLAWSTWDVPGAEPWHATLVVFDLPGENRRALSLQAESASGQERGASDRR